MPDRRSLLAGQSKRSVIHAPPQRVATNRRTPSDSHRGHAAEQRLASSRVLQGLRVRGESEWWVHVAPNVTRGMVALGDVIRINHVEIY